MNGRRFGGKRNSSSGQAPILAALLFLLLVPATVIIAENATDNITGDLVANITLGTLGNATNVTLPVNETLSENTTTSIMNESNTTLPSDNQTPPGDNVTLPVNDTEPINESNVKLPDNTTIPLNETNTILSDINITEPVNDTNQTLPDINASEPFNDTNLTIPEIPTGPELEVTLDIPERADRNQEFQVSATVTNTGDRKATGVELEWLLPKGFLITQGSGNKTCDIPSGAACESQLMVAASLSSMLGEQDIKILVRYHD